MRTCALPWRIGRLIATGTLLTATALAGQRPPPGQDWRLDPAPFVRIAATGDDGTTRFLSAPSATRLGDGTLVVADPWQARVVLLAPDGAVRRVVGRRGSGPGEWQSPDWVARVGTDSIVVLDPVGQRLVLLDASGRIVRERRQRLDGVQWASDGAGRLATLRVPDNLPRPGVEPVAPLRSRVVVLTVTGDSVWGIADVEAGQATPGGQLTQLALGRRELFLGTQAAARVDRWAIGGATSTAFAVGSMGRPRRPVHLERELDRLVAPMTVPSERTQMRQMLRGMVRPGPLPPYSALRVDPRGLLWAVTSVPGDGITWLEAFGGDGRRRARLSLPGDVAVHEIGLDYVLGTRPGGADEEDEVVVFRLHRGG